MTAPKPKFGTPEFEIYAAGARAESEARTKGMTPGVRQIDDCVEVLGQKGETADYVIEWLARVFTAEWSWWRRLKLAWKLVRG